MVMPLIGFDEFPINPLMREATVTNKNPNTIIKSAANRFARSPVCAPGTGLNVRNAQIIAMIAIEPTTTTFIERSRSVRLIAGIDSRLARTSFRPAVSAAKIVGIVLISVINPEHATAPAPIGRMYVAQSWSGDICGIGMVLG